MNSNDELQGLTERFGMCEVGPKTNIDKFGNVIVSRKEKEYTKIEHVEDRIICVDLANAKDCSREILYVTKKSEVIVGNEE